jgi:hypothetical protein
MAMAKIFQRIKAKKLAIKNSKINTPYRGGILAKKVTTKTVVPNAANPSLLTQKPNQDCACIRRQRNRANMIRFKRQLPEQNLNQ